jgi:hypothetical protein
MASGASARSAWWVVLFGLLALAAGAGNLWAEETEEAPVENSEAEEEPETVATPGTVAVDQASRVATNFVTLMDRAVRGALRFTKDLLLACLLWTLGGLFLGALGGFLLWYYIRRRKGFDAPWGWYRWVRWAWFAVFVLPLTLGLAYAGLFFGAGRCLNHYIHDVRVLDQAAAQLLCAVILDKAEYEARGDETAQQYAKVLGDAPQLAPLVQADVEIAAQELRSKIAPGPLTGGVFDLLAPLVLDGMPKEIYGVDPRMLVVVFVSHPNLDAYLNENPQASPALAALAVHFKHARDQAGRVVFALVMPNALLGLGVGLAVPLGAWGIFCLVVFLCRPRERATVGPRTAPASKSPQPLPDAPPPC